MTADGTPGGPGAFGNFEDLREIGRGGFAVVYLATQRGFGRQVALKVLDPTADRLALERFERECEAMGRLSAHPNIVTIFDAGVTEEGNPYLVMEHMSGGSLDDRLDGQGPRPWTEVLDIGVKLCGALETAHRATILHRDVKPANVLVSPFGEPCLSDFGLARFGAEAKTTGVVTATLLHAPPEILDGKPATPRSDLYSLGSTLHTLLTGTAPYWRAADESLLALIARIADEPPPALPADVPGPVRTALAAAMAKEVEARPATAAELGRLLRTTQDELGQRSTPLRLADDEVIAAAADDLVPSTPTPTDPDRTVARRGGPADDGDRTVKRDHTPVKGRPVPPPTPSTAPARRRRWPVVVAGALLLIALAAGAIVLLGGDDGPGPSAAGTGPDATAPTVPPDATKADLVDAVNDHRRAEGLSPVTVDPQLAREAQAHAEAAAAAGEFPPVDPQIGSRHPDRWFTIYASAIAGESAADAQENAIASPTTEPKLVAPGADVIGVGLAESDDGTIWLAEFLAKRN